MESHTPSSKEIPWLTVVSVLDQAQSFFKDIRNLGYSDLLLKYQSGECLITSIDLHASRRQTYNVQLAGASTIVTLD
jgi:hypothetical protein